MTKPHYIHDVDSDVFLTHHVRHTTGYDVYLRRGDRGPDLVGRWSSVTDETKVHPLHMVYTRPDASPDWTRAGVDAMAERLLENVVSEDDSVMARLERIERAVTRLQTVEREAPVAKTTLDGANDDRWLRERAQFPLQSSNEEAPALETGT